jgi:hypothetical protein
MPTVEQEAALALNSTAWRRAGRSHGGAFAAGEGPRCVAVGAYGVTAAGSRARGSGSTGTRRLGGGCRRCGEAERVVLPWGAAEAARGRERSGAMYGGAA